MADVIIDNREKKSKNENFLSKRQHWLLFLVGWFGFSLVASIIGVVAELILPYENALQNSGVSIFINCLAYGIIFVALLVIFHFSNVKKLVEKFVYLKTYIAAIICLLSVIAFEILYSQFIDIIGVSITDNANQGTLEDLMRLYPFLCIVFFGIIGPICEELTYRVGLFSLCKRKSKILGYIVTPIFFAFIHFNFPLDQIGTSEFGPLLINELINLPAYCFAGVAFCFTYDHYGFESSVTAHILNNILSLTLALKK